MTKILVLLAFERILCFTLFDLNGIILAQLMETEFC